MCGQERSRVGEAFFGAYPKTPVFHPTGVRGLSGSRKETLVYTEGVNFELFVSSGGRPPVTLLLGSLNLGSTSLSRCFMSSSKKT